MLLSFLLYAHLLMYLRLKKYQEDLLPLLLGFALHEEPSFTAHRIMAAHRLQSRKRKEALDCNPSPLRGREKKVTIFWAELDLNQRRSEPTDLQSVPINHSGIDPFFFYCKNIRSSLKFYHIKVKKTTFFLLLYDILLLRV